MSETTTSAQTTNTAEVKPDATTTVTESTKEGATTAAAGAAKLTTETTTLTTATGVPEKYELKAPEGSQLTAEDLEKIASIAKERGLSNEQAQTLVEIKDQTAKDAVEAYVSAQSQKLKTEAEAWIAQSKADKEFGGENFKTNIELAHRALKHFGSETFTETLEKTGLGNHPELVRIFYRIGKEMAEDKFVVSSAHGSGKKDPAEILYGNKT